MEVIFLAGILFYLLIFKLISYTWSLVIIIFFLINLYLKILNITNKKILLFIKKKKELCYNNKRYVYFTIINIGYILTYVILLFYSKIKYLLNKIYIIKYLYQRVYDINTKWQNYRREKLISFFIKILNKRSFDFLNNDISDYKEINKKKKLNTILETDNDINNFLLKIDNKYN